MQKISEDTQQKLQILKQNYDDTDSKHSSDIRPINLEEIDPELPPVVSKLYPLPLKHHTSIKKEIENLLEAGLIKRSMSPYAASIIVVPRKSK